MSGKGRRPRISKDLNEERMITWRITGAIHNKLVRVTSALGLSLNYFITKAVTEKLAEEEKNLEK